MRRLEGKRLLVTGSSTGIGEAIARRCVAEGARVLVHGMDEAETRGAAEALGCPWLVGDLADPAVPSLLQSSSLL